MVHDYDFSARDHAAPLAITADYYINKLSGQDVSCPENQEGGSGPLKNRLSPQIAGFTENSALIFTGFAWFIRRILRKDILDRGRPQRFWGTWQMIFELFERMLIR